MQSLDKLRWYRGPWRWDSSGGDPYWTAPAAAVGSIDLRSLAQQMQAGGNEGLGLFVAYDPLPSEFDLLGVGSPRDIKIDARLMSAIPKRLGARLAGEDLLSVLRSALTDGSDPTGDEFARPIMPGRDRAFEFRIGPWCDREIMGPLSAHWDKVQDVLRADFTKDFEACSRGEMKDAEHYRRILDATCEKYGIEDWRQVVPVKLRASVPGRLPHETSISDDFNRTDATSLGTSSGGWSWSDLAGDWQIVSNEARANSTNTQDAARADSDLSSSDVSAVTQITRLIGPGSGVSRNATGPMARKDSSATLTYYHCRLAIGTSNVVAQLYKVVGGAFTQLGSDVTVTYSAPDEITLECNGSSIAMIRGGSSIISMTDTAISSGVRTGMRAFNSTGMAAADRCMVDNFSAEDLIASTIKYTQLESTTRGIARGTWHRSVG